MKLTRHDLLLAVLPTAVVTAVVLALRWLLGPLAILQIRADPTFLP